MTMKVYYDASGAVLGRLGSTVCKELLKGKEVVVINSEKTIITGTNANIMDNIRWWRGLGGKGLKGPRIPKMADRLLKRMIRGMLPWDRTRGQEAWRRLTCYVGTGDLKSEELKNVKTVGVKKVLKSMTLGDISKLL